MPLPTRYRLFTRLLTLRDRAVRLCRGPARRGAARRHGLALEGLEDWSVPAAVGPNEYWDDGYYDANGYRVGVTVYVHNLGGTWLSVTGGSGAVSVGPGSPLSGGTGQVLEGPSLPLEGPPPPPPPHYAFTVPGALGPGSGDVTWSGEAENLYIQASDDVASVTIAGDL